MQFNQIPLIQNIIIILPEILVIVTMLTIILLDIVLLTPLPLFITAILGLTVSSVILLYQWNSSPSIGFLGSIQVNVLSTAFRYTIISSAIISVLLSTEYIKRSGMRIAEFLVLVLGATLGGMFLCIANDLITMYVALECLGLSSYLLVGYTKRDVRSNEAAIKYLLVGATSSAILAYGFSWLYGISGGEIQLEHLVNGIIEHTGHPFAIWIPFICILVGIGFKISIVPFHQWTPDVYEGSPTPVVAFLSVGSKVAGLALTTRILSIVFPSIEQEWHMVLELLASLSMIFGNLIAATQTSLKRMLAYSSISQAGYVIIGIIAGNPFGYTSLITYVIIYTFMNLGAFACVILMGLRTGTDQIRDYTGLYLKDPLLTFSLSVCLLSLAGIPPLGGFFGKIYLFWSGWNAGMYQLVFVGLITSVISIYYYLRIIKVMLTKEVNDISPYLLNYTDSSFALISSNTIQWSIAICVIVSLSIGFVLNPIISTTNAIIMSSIPIIA